MPERAFLTETWDDDWFQELDKDRKYLFIYLWSNSHVTQAGLYHITPRSISFETRLPEEALPDLLNSLAPKVIWYQNSNLIWVKNFIKRQSKSPKFLAAAAKCLTTINHDGAIKELLEYNLNRYSISIPYQYYIDKLSIFTRASVSASSTVTGSDTKELGVVKGEEETAENKTPRGKSKNMRTFGELSNVKLTPEEYEKLVARFGAQGATSWIDELSLAKASKGYKSKSDYATILAWERRKRLEGGASGADKRHLGQGEPLTKGKQIRDLKGQPLR